MNSNEILEKHGFIKGLIKRGRTEEALNGLDRILLSNPEYSPAWEERAGLLDKLGAYFDAVVNYDKAIALRPKDGGLYNNRASAYMSMSEYQLALRDFNKALEYIPQQGEVHSNIGSVYRRLGDEDTAIPHFRKAIELKPDYPDAHLGLSLSLLSKMEFDEGWREFEWRWKHDSMVPRGLKLPVWAGERASNPDDALLLCAEQGHGDALQFMRYARFVKEMWGGKLYIECKLPMARLAQRQQGVDKVLIPGEIMPSEVVTHICMLSVPPIVGTEKGFIGPYIKPDPSLIVYFAEEIKALPPGFRIGVCWAGMSREHHEIARQIDMRRSMTLDHFGLLARINGIVWVSLQKGPPAAQVKRPPPGMFIIDTTEKLDDFLDTAALIANCDLVISVDTAVVHVAAAMGKPTWLLSRFDGCWRWFGDRPDSPWYPTLKQYRQKVDMDWTHPIDAMARDLQRVVVEARRDEARRRVA